MNDLSDMTEKKWTAQVVELARTVGWKRYHTFRSDRSTPGWPDEALVRERLILLELKTETGKLSEPQRDWLGTLHKAGVEVYVARPHDLDDLAQILAVRHNGTGDFPSDQRGETARAARSRLLEQLRAEIQAERSTTA